MRFLPLADSRREIEEVTRLWRETDAAVLVLDGSHASEPIFKEKAAGWRVLHLATHGFFLRGACLPAPGTRDAGGLWGDALARAGAQEENPLLLSGLAMAGANRRASAGPDDDDGILTAEEVTALDLAGVEWAVLSACDTGIGEIKAGEGVFGLRRAFQLAGSRTVIMSLWSVEDWSTMRWMRALYEARLREKLDTADAVREASLTVLRERREKGASTHPFFWAGFVATGDWR